MSNDKTFNALEILALNDLPEAARIKRMAYLIRRHNWVSTYQPRLKDFKAAIEKFHEPRGMKIALQKILKTEVARQTMISQRRSAKRSFYTRSSYTLRTGAYDPVTFKTALYSYPDPSRRWKMVVMARFGPAFSANAKARAKARREGRPEPERIVPCTTWNFPARNHPSEVDAAGKFEGAYLLVSSPGYVKTAAGARSFQHNVGFLLVKFGEIVKSIRIPRSADTIPEALASLKTSHVVKAEERGDEVKIDWERELFLVRNPKRSKWRELPFKSHIRKRKTKAESDEA